MSQEKKLLSKVVGGVGKRSRDSEGRRTAT